MASWTAVVGCASAAAVGIHRLQVPTPFRLGAVNAYLIEDDPLTLVDPGPRWAPSLEALEWLLREHGHAITDVGLLLVTHQHVDHGGLLDALARRTGAEVACLDVLARILEDFDAAARANDHFVEQALRRHGVDARVLLALREGAAVSRRLGAVVRVDRPLPDGGVIRLRDRTIRVLHRPGHSPSDTVFHDESNRVALVGDHLLARGSSTALLARPLDAPSSQQSPIIAYRRSLRATRTLDARLALPGHGEPITGLREVVDSRLRRHERNAERVLGILRNGARTAAELAVDVFGDRACERPHVYVSEVLNSVELLLARARICAIADRDGQQNEGLVRFAV